MRQIYLLVIFLLMRMECHAQREPEELLASFFVDYGDFYKDFCLRYQGKQWVETPDLENGRFVLWEGMVAGFSPKGLQYCGQLVFEVERESPPTCSEYLSISGRVKTKDYIFSSASGLRNSAYEPDLEMRKEILTPFIEPHGLALASHNGIFGRKSELNPRAFLTKTKFVKETKSKKIGVVSGVWHTLNDAMKITIEFDSGFGNLPIVCERSLVSEKKTAPVGFFSTTKTKWKKHGDDRFVPEKIQLSGNVGEKKYEYEFDFDWMDLEKWRKSASTLDLSAIGNGEGTKWWTTFSGAFDESKNLQSKSLK